eukprot:COSAG02_NODE_23260_length_724_cov_1.475200_1_plen_208_part_00
MPGSPSAPGLAAALARVSEAVKQGEQYTIADNEPHWPYCPEDDDTSDDSVADLNDLLRVVSQVSDALGPGAAPVAALCSDITKGCERFESTTKSMEERATQAKHEQTESGYALRELQQAAGLSLKEFAEHRRAEYFKKLAAGELSTFEVTASFVTCSVLLLVRPLTSLVGTTGFAPMVHAGTRGILDSSGAAVDHGDVAATSLARND